VGFLVTVLLQNYSPDSDSETSLKIGQYLMKLRRMKLRRTKKCASFLGHLYTLNLLILQLHAQPSVTPNIKNITLLVDYNTIYYYTQFTSIWQP